MRRFFRWLASWFRPRHTTRGAILELIRGLRDGSIRLDNNDDE